MFILESRALRGPNYFHQKPVILIKVDLEELEEKPTDLVPDFKDNLEMMIPTMIDHTCSPGVRGGFFQRLKRGTWAGHVAEHIAIELQNLIGHNITYGKTVTLKDKGKYLIAYRYLNEAVGLMAGEMAIEITNNLFNGKTTSIEPYLKKLNEVNDETQFGPSTRSIVNEAEKRGIPHIRLNEYSYVQLGTGIFQRRIEATLMDSTSSLAVEIAGDKERTKNILKESNIPVPDGVIVNDEEDLSDVVSKLKFPLVVKPVSGNHGRGVTTNIKTYGGLIHAFNKAGEISSSVIVEQYLEGNDYRLLLIDGKLEAATLREPAFVMGDGTKNIRELIEEENLNPDRGDGHSKNLTKITFDSDMDFALSEKNLNLESIPKKYEKVYVKTTANISSGGTAIDITDIVHPYNKVMAERIANIIGLDVMGIDIIAKDIETPIKKGSGGIIEVNAGPGFRMHLAPTLGKPRNVAKAVVDMLFPEDVESQIPICAITGTNGKTTTTRLVNHIISSNGKTVGMSSTDGVIVDNLPILKGDYSGPGGAQAVLKDKRSEVAVLEVARGGIIRRGLGFKECDVGVLLNVSSDHLGLDGIDTLEDLTRVKSTVTCSVKQDGFAIFNADNKQCLMYTDKTPGNIVYFSKNKDNPLLSQKLKGKNFNVTIIDDSVVIQKASGDIEIVNVLDVPMTFRGTAEFNIENVLAAVAICYALGISIENIKSGLLSFEMSIGQSPGRMNLIEIGDFHVIIDYGHNAGAYKSTGEFIMNFTNGRKLRLACGVGNRRTEDILEMGRVGAKYSDYYVLSDATPKKRKVGETSGLLKQGLIEGGFDEKNIEIIYDEYEAVDHLLNMAQSGDLVFLQIDDVPGIINQVLRFKENYLNYEDKQNKYINNVII